MTPPPRYKLNWRVIEAMAAIASLGAWLWVMIWEIARHL